MGSIFVVGSINTDLVAYVDRLPAPGETVGGAQMAETGGGKGANQAVASCRAGANTVMVSAVGRDTMGRARLQELGDVGVDVSHVKVVDGVRSGIALISVDRDGENQIVVAPGANAHVALLAQVATTLRAEDVVVLQNEIPTRSTVDAARAAKTVGATVVWNIAPSLDAPSVEEQAAIATTDYLVVNAGELAALMGAEAGELADDGERAAHHARAQLGAGSVLLTMGKRGACIVSSEGGTSIAAPEVEVVDSVGAGDCLTGVFAAGLLEGLSSPAALGRAVVAAALSVTRRGAQAGMPTADDIDEASSPRLPDRRS